MAAEGELSMRLSPASDGELLLGLTIFFIFVHLYQKHPSQYLTEHNVDGLKISETVELYQYLLKDLYCFSDSIL